MTKGKVGNPWQDNYIRQYAPSKGNASMLDSVLRDATDESPLQKLLAETPAIVACLLPPAHATWCFDRPTFAGELVPDFLLCHKNSAGFNWTMVELESPTAVPLIKAGRPSAKLNTAFSQIRDWRIWLRENVAYAQHHLGYTGLDAECAAYIIIGRRSAIESKFARVYAELSRNGITVMTYDRLAEMCIRATGR